jgi:hypothetical protein
MERAMDGPHDATASAFLERPDYRVDLLARTNFAQVARLAGYVAFDQDTVSVTIGTGRYTGVRP